MNQKPTISVITAVLNEVCTVRYAIESVLTDCPNEIEYIIVDAGSTDGTLEIINEYRNRLSRIISEPDDGIYDAWNKGLHLAKGDYVCFLGSDDVFVKGALNVLLKHVKLNPELDYVCALSEYVGRRRKVIGRPLVWREFCRNMKIAHVGSLHSRRLFNKYGKFDAQYRIAGDYEFLLRCGNSVSAGFINEVTVKCGSEGVSRSKGIETMREARRAKIKYNVCPVFLSYMDFYAAALKYIIRNFFRI